ncbi:hypothetical protein FQN53_009183 [Emmonsiellopsis sp. PD_33]|nr:hypothetical protein FQN53_009183 [Emmonsiellopsis sp. PD_33]
MDLGMGALARHRRPADARIALVRYPTGIKDSKRYLSHYSTVVGMIQGGTGILFDEAIGMINRFTYGYSKERGPTVIREVESPSVPDGPIPSRNRIREQ